MQKKGTAVLMGSTAIPEVDDLSHGTVLRGHGRAWQAVQGISTGMLVISTAVPERCIFFIRPCKV